MRTIAECVEAAVAETKAPAAPATHVLTDQPRPAVLFAANPRALGQICPAQSPLRRLVIRGSLWTIAGYGSSQVLRLGSNLVLTRLLTPEIFGVMALVNLVLQGLQMFSDVGITPSIIQNRRGEEPEFFNTAWTIQAVRGGCLALFACIIAAPVTAFYGRVELKWLLPVVGMTALIGGFNSASLAIANRRLQLGRLTILELLAQGISVCVMILLAFIHRSIWALVFGAVAGAIIRLALSHKLFPDVRCRFTWDSGSARTLMSFGKWIFASSLITFIAMQGDRIVLGKLVSASELGVYSMAAMLALMPQQVITMLSSRVLLPLVSRILCTSGTHDKRISQTRLVLLLIAAPSCAFLFTEGDALTRILFDARYHSAGTLVSILAIGTWLNAISISYGEILISAGKPQYIAWGTATRACLFLGIAPAIFVKYGVVGVAGLASVSELGVLCVCFIGAHRIRVGRVSMDVALTALTFAGATALALMHRGMNMLFQHTLPGLLLSLLVTGGAVVIVGLSAAGWSGAGRFGIKALDATS